MEKENTGKLINKVDKTKVKTSEKKEKKEKKLKKEKKVKRS